MGKSPRKDTWGMKQLLFENLPFGDDMVGWFCQIWMKGFKICGIDLCFWWALGGWVGKLTLNWAYDYSIWRYSRMDSYDDVTFEFWRLCGFQKAVGDPNGAYLNCALTSQFLVFACVGPWQLMWLWDGRWAWFRFQSGCCVSFHFQSSCWAFNFLAGALCEIRGVRYL